MRILVIVLLLAPLALLDACSPRGAFVVAFSQIGADNPWRTAETESIREEAKRRGIELRFADGQGKQEKQVADLRAFLAMGVDAIVLAPQTKAGWQPVLEEVRAAKVPLVLVDRGVDVADPGLYATLIASDFVQEGRAAGELLAKRLSGKGKVVELCGTTGSDPALERAKGFREALARSPGLEVVASQDGDFKRQNARQIMDSLLLAQPRIDAVYAHNDDMAIGAIQALEAAGKKPGQDVLVVSIDGMRFALEEVVKGRLAASVECSPLLGPLAFDAIERLRKGQPVEKRIVVQDQVFTAENAAAALPGRRY
jgi:simple sugar transport system substrate-binding protein